MRREIIQCDGCEKQYNIPPSMGDGEWERFAESTEWMTLKNAYHGMAAHFCSSVCLTEWAVRRTGIPVAGSLEVPATKVRRFRLTDGETADEFEGVLWGGGRVSVEVRPGHIAGWSDWGQFKQQHDGCGITWIDQDIREEVTSDAN